MSIFMDEIFVKAVTYINFNTIRTHTYTHRYEFFTPTVATYWLTELISLHPQSSCLSPCLSPYVCLSFKLREELDVDPASYHLVRRQGLASCASKRLFLPPWPGLTGVLSGVFSVLLLENPSQSCHSAHRRLRYDIVKISWILLAKRLIFESWHHFRKWLGLSVHSFSLFHQ